MCTSQRRRLSAIMSFMRGTFVFDSASHTVRLGKHPAIPLPASLQAEEGFHTQLCSSSTQRHSENADTHRRCLFALRMVLFVSLASYVSARAAPKTAGQSGFIASGPIRNTLGIESDEALPQWIIDSITRQRLFWNKLAYLCREARRACSAVPMEVIQNFITESVRPSIDDF